MHHLQSQLLEAGAEGSLDPVEFKTSLSLVEWRTPLISAFRRQRQGELCEFEVSLVYTEFQDSWG